MTSYFSDSVTNDTITQAGKPSIDDLDTMIDWLYMMWECGALPDSRDEISGDIAGPALRLINMLCTTVQAREKSARITAAKKAYAAEHGIPFNQVRYGASK
jgi:hypothetical protein